MRAYLLILILSSTVSLQYGQQSSGIDWDYEIDLLGKELQKRNPNLFNLEDSARFFKRMKDLALTSEGKSTFDMAVGLQQILALQGDANTRVNFHFLIDKTQILPMDCYWFEDGIYFTGLREEYKELGGERWTAINGFPLGRVIDSLSTLLSKHHPSHLKETIPRMLVWTPLLQHFGFADPLSMQIEVRDSMGESTIKELILPARNSEWMRIGPDSIPLGWKDTKEYFWSEYLSGERLYYMQYNKCWSREAEVDYGSGASALFMPSMKEFGKQVLTDLKKLEVNKVVIDLRFNSGGHPSPGEYLIAKLSKSSLSKMDKLYVIIGRQSSNTALIHVADLVERFPLVLVGETSGGSLRHFGNVGRFVLPESHLVISHSTQLFSPGISEGPLEPNIKTPLYFKDYLKGIDPVMEYICGSNPE